MFQQAKSLILSETLAKKTSISEIGLPHFAGVDAAIAVDFITETKASNSFGGLEATAVILID